MPAAARVGDNIKQDAPHCHAPIHPAAPTPTPSAHPAMPLAITGPGCQTVKINGMTASVVTDQSAPCSLASCLPNGPGMIVLGSFSVFFGGLPAARAGDLTLHTGCVAPIPSPTGSVQKPCSNNVDIG